MSELLDKQVNVQKESLKKTSGVHASSHKPMKQCAMKMKERNKERKKERKKVEEKKRLTRQKHFCGRRDLYGRIRRLAEPISTNFRLLILQTMRVLILE